MRVGFSAQQHSDCSSPPSRWPSCFLPLAREGDGSLPGKFRVAVLLALAGFLLIRDSNYPPAAGAASRRPQFVDIAPKSTLGYVTNNDFTGLPLIHISEPTRLGMIS